ncbi:MAG: hypothetical protein LAQ69_31610 [Acidobacteriia bacterium]|nr:hypothetical protein [Terriglobia bacterium]
MIIDTVPEYELARGEARQPRRGGSAGVASGAVGPRGGTLARAPVPALKDAVDLLPKTAEVVLALPAGAD